MPSTNGRILNTVTSIAFIFIGYLAIKTGMATKGLYQVAAYFVGIVLLISGLGMIFAPEGMRNIGGAFLRDAYPATKAPFEQPGWEPATVSDTILEKNTSNPLDADDKYPGYSSAGMSYTFDLPQELVAA